MRKLNRNVETDQHAANGSINESAAKTKMAGHISKEDPQEAYIYFWQSYPTDIQERINWVLDLLFNFRGPGWNWAVPPLVSPELGQPSKSRVSRTGLRSFVTRRALLADRLPRLLIAYFLLDLVKTLMRPDPYFIFGPNHYSLPSHLERLPPLVLKFYRQVLMGTGIISALEGVFAFTAIVATYGLGTQVLGLRGEPWYFQTTWGPFSTVLNHGLAGLWGSWWHQTFRMAFAGPSNHLISKGTLKAGTNAAKACSLFFAFSISGLLHAAGSATQLGPSRPWAPIVFFLLQAVGIALQTAICTQVKPYMTSLPTWARQAGNFIFAAAWLFMTGPWLLDDLSRGGIWLFEPVPLSLFGGLGLRGPHEGLWCWGFELNNWAWVIGDHWWQSGLAL